MNKRLYLFACAVTLLLFGFTTIQKEILLASGDDLFLELAPVDPRSLMQGDYMILRYALDNAIRESVHKDNDSASEERVQPKFVIVKKNERGIAEYVSIGATRALDKDEYLLRFNKTKYGILPNSYFFEEGQRELFSEAKYAHMKVDKNGSNLLVDLLDKDLNRL